MERLTRKDRRTLSGYYIPTDYSNYHEKEFIKLGKLEDLEEELGIDLITLFKALKEGVYVKEHITPDDISFTKYSVRTFIFNDCYDEFGFGYGKDSFSDKPLWWLSLKDYGKTWSLRKEDLEDEKEN